MDLLQLHIETHRGMMEGAKNDSWSMSGNFIYRHHVEPRVKLCAPREESFPIPLEYTDVTRTMFTAKKFGGFRDQRKWSVVDTENRIWCAVDTQGRVCDAVETAGRM